MSEAGVPSIAGADDERRHAVQEVRSHRDSGQHGRPGPARLPRLLAEQVLDPQDLVERQVAVLALQLLGEGLPAERGAPVDRRDVPRDLGPAGRADRGGRLGVEQHEARHADPFRRGLEDQEAAHPVADRHGVRADALEPGRHVVEVRLEGEALGIGRAAPEVVAEVERVALPAAPGEVAQPALPEPRSGKLAVDVEERAAARAPLRQPALDVDAALLDLDLVLADRPAAGRRAPGCRRGTRIVAIERVVVHVTTRGG